MLHFFFALFLLFAADTAFATNDDGDSIAERLGRQVAAFPQEKLYTQTDHEEYFAGDTIWMRHHVVDALTGRPLPASRYVYVELLSPVRILVRRVMMRQDEYGAIYGCMPIDSDLPSGRYSLRAYTKHMAETTPDYLFVRSLRIRNVMESSVRISHVTEGGRLHLSFTNPKTGESIHNGNVKVESAAGNVAFTGNTENGVDIHMLDIGSRQNCLLVNVGNYSEYISVADERIDLQLMPEGGHIVLGQRCRVAYKAVANTGLGVDMTARVTDDRGTVVAENSATHCGMGIFYVTPQPGHSYTVVCTSRDGRTATARLPKAETKIPSLSVAQNSMRFIASVLWPDDGSIPFGNVRDTLWMIVHQGGMPLYARRIVQPTVCFSRDVFHDGVVHFLLADKKLNVISERLCFAWNGRSVYNDAGAVSASPADRNMQSVGISLPGGVDADCAVSIVDADAAKADTVQNIVSMLLLSQELRGYVEHPKWYFADRMRSGQLDVLMLTQGWRRYDIQKAMKGDIGKAAYGFERSMNISGKVTSDVSPKGKKDVAVTVSSSVGGYADRLMNTHRAMTAAMESVRLSDVLQIDIIKGPLAGTLAGVVNTPNNMGMQQSAIVVTTRSGNCAVGTNTQFIRPIGYQKPVDFYNPRYEAPDGYALRHTIYWNPSLKIKDGKASFGFLPNGAGCYKISVEGIGAEGQVVCITNFLKF